MAQKRMIDKKISVSEQVANLSIPAQCLYTWSVPHADDIGLIPSSSRTLKATIVPMWNMDLDAFEGLTSEILKEGLWSIFEYDGKVYYRLTKFTRYQSLKRDRQPQTILPIMYSTDARETWELLEDIGFHLENFGIQELPEVKRSEVKRSEVSKGAKKFQKPKIEDVVAYCKERTNNVDPQKFFNYYESKGWLVGKSPMKDWKAAIRTWEGNRFDTKNATSIKPGKYKNL